MLHVGRSNFWSGTGAPRTVAPPGAAVFCLPLVSGNRKLHPYQPATLQHEKKERRKLPGDATRHLPQDVNKREIARVKKCEPVPKPERS
jgi:hypothetical protein